MVLQTLAPALAPTLAISSAPTAFQALRRKLTTETDPSTGRLPSSRPTPVLQNSNSQWTNSFPTSLSTAGSSMLPTVSPTRKHRPSRSPTNAPSIPPSVASFLPTNTPSIDLDTAYGPVNCQLIAQLKPSDLILALEYVLYGLIKTEQFLKGLIPLTFICTPVGILSQTNYNAADASSNTPTSPTQVPTTVNDDSASTAVPSQQQASAYNQS